MTLSSCFADMASFAACVPVGGADLWFLAQGLFILALLAFCLWAMGAVAWDIAGMVVAAIRRKGLARALADAGLGVRDLGRAMARDLRRPMTVYQEKTAWVAYVGGYAALMLLTWATGGDFLTWYSPNLEPTFLTLGRCMAAGYAALGSWALAGWACRVFELAHTERFAWAVSNLQASIRQLCIYLAHPESDDLDGMRWRPMACAPWTQLYTAGDEDNMTPRWAGRSELPTPNSQLSTSDAERRP